MYNTVFVYTSVEPPAGGAWNVGDALPCVFGASEAEGTEDVLIGCSFDWSGQWSQATFCHLGAEVRGKTCPDPVAR